MGTRQREPTRSGMTGARLLAGAFLAIWPAVSGQERSVQSCTKPTWDHSSRQQGACCRRGKGASKHQLKPGIPSEAALPELCARQCAQRAQCTHFTHSTRWKDCFLCSGCDHREARTSSKEYSSWRMKPCSPLTLAQQPSVDTNVGPSVPYATGAGAGHLTGRNASRGPEVLRQPHPPLPAALLHNVALTERSSHAPSLDKTAFDLPRVTLIVPGFGGDKARKALIRANLLKLRNMSFHLEHCVIFVYKTEAELPIDIGDFAPCEVVRNKGFWMHHVRAVRRSSIANSQFVLLLQDGLLMDQNVDVREMARIMDANCVGIAGPACRGCSMKRFIRPNSSYVTSTVCGRVVEALDPQFTMYTTTVFLCLQQLIDVIGLDTTQPVGRWACYTRLFATTPGPPSSTLCRLGT